MIRLRTKTKFNRQTIQRRVEQATFKSLGQAGGAIRLTASRSIRKRKKPSRPGTAPNTPTGHLRRVIRYSVDQHKTEVAIGPTNSYARTIWNLHEFGGRIRKRSKPIKQRRFKIGDFGPIRRDRTMARDRLGRFARRSNHFSRIRLRTKAQVARANRIIENENAMRVADSKKLRNYPKRPFMGPALERMRSRLPKFWANSVKG